MRVETQYTELHGNHRWNVLIAARIYNEANELLGTTTAWVVRPETRQHAETVASAAYPGDYAGHSGVRFQWYDADIAEDALSAAAPVRSRNGADWYNDHDIELMRRITNGLRTTARYNLRRVYDTGERLAMENHIGNAMAEAFHHTDEEIESAVQFMLDNAPRMMRVCDEHEGDLYTALDCTWRHTQHPRCDVCEAAMASARTYMMFTEEGTRTRGYVCNDCRPSGSTYIEGANMHTCFHCSVYFTEEAQEPVTPMELFERMVEEWEIEERHFERQFGMFPDSSGVLASVCAENMMEMAEEAFDQECQHCGVESADVMLSSRRYCHQCEIDNHIWQVKSYSFKPAPEFHPELPDDPRVLYHGFEFEVAGMGHSAACRWASEQDIDPKLVYLKSDSSVSSGTEVVTHPFTMPWALENFPFDAWDKATDYGAIPEHSSAGTHIHVSKASFSRGHMWKFLQVHFRLPAFIQKLGGRPSGTYCNWSLESVRAQAKDVSMKRYVGTGRLAVNVSPTHTVELRYPAGGFSAYLARKNIELPNALYQFSSEITVQNIKDGIIDNPSYLLWWLGQEEAQFPTVLDYISKQIPQPKPFERSNH